MLLLAGIIFSIGSICAALQDGPFKYDMSREIGIQESSYMDQVKEELLSKFIQSTFELSSKDESKLNLIESNSIIDEALVEPFTDKYDKESQPLDQSTRMKRARKLTKTTAIIPETEVTTEDESVHGFVRQLIPSLLPIPVSNSSELEDEFEDTSNQSRIDVNGHGTNLTTYGGDGNRNGINSTKPSGGTNEDDRKREEERRKKEERKKEEERKREENRKKEEERKREENRRKEEAKKNNTAINNIHETRRQPMCPAVITTTPAPSNVEVSTTIRVDIRPRSKPVETKPTPSQPIYPPQNRRDGDVICTDRSLGKNCSEYIISLYGDEMALYLKVRSPLKPGALKPNKPYVPKYTINQLPFYIRRNGDTAAAYVPKSPKTVTPIYKSSPIYKPSPKYFNAAKNYVKPTSTPPVRSVSFAPNRVAINAQRRMLPTQPYTTPKYMKERRIQVYPTQRTIPEPRSIPRKPPQQSTPMRYMTPRSVSVQKKALPTHTARPNIPEVTKYVHHKLKLLKDLTASKMGGKGKLQNRIKQNKPDPRLVSKHGNKISASNNHKQKVHPSTTNRPVVRKSDLQNMIVPPKQKYPETYRPNSYQLRGKYVNVPRPKPKPDHLPGVISGLTKREGVTFFNYYPFKDSASPKRMKRSAAGRNVEYLKQTAFV